MKKTHLAYLAGLWDGEGSITVWKSRRKDQKNSIRVIPCLTMTNTNKEMIDWVCKALDELGVSYQNHYYERPNSKWIYQITCRNFNSVCKILVAIQPYLVAKKRQADLTLDFVRGRLKMYKNKPCGWNRYAPYSQEELDMCDEIMSLNKRGANKEKVQRL